MSLDGSGMSDLNDVLTSPAIKAGLGVLTVTRPEIGLALQLAVSLLNGWHQEAQVNVAIATIDSMAAEHVKRLALTTLNPVERNEIEIRLHELLTVLIKLGGLV